MNTTRTFTDEQIEERGRSIVMAAGDLLLLSVSSPQAFNSDRVSALSEAVHAGMTMVEFGPQAEAP